MFFTFVKNINMEPMIIRKKNS